MNTIFCQDSMPDPYFDPYFLSFASFMQKALYDPVDGYYGSGRASIGKKGDFFTNVSVGKIYGKILTLFFKELWEKMDRPIRFTIVEQGAHDGRLAHDILESLASMDEEGLFARSVHYIIVEPLTTLQEHQRENLKNFCNISWHKEIKELHTFQGIHFSNELLDAFPVDLLVWNGSTWLEQCVEQTSDASYAWTTRPLQRLELLTIAEQLPKNLLSGFQWEVRLGVESWLTEISARMQRGMILIADYGYAGVDRFASYRAQGSIACYKNHHRFDNPLEEVGKRDITTHVDFTDLATRAQQAGYELLGYSDQHHFLIGASEQWLRSFEKRELDKTTQHDLRLLQTLLHPETMGRQFKFLGLGKNISSAPPLSAFRYQRPGISVL